MAWSPQYVTVGELEDWISDAAGTHTAELTLAIEAASRAVDKATGRQFGLLPSAEDRWYTAEYDRNTCRWIVDIDDLMTTVGLVVQVDNDGDGIAESSVTDYTLSPVNAAANGRPWTRVEILPKSAVKPNGLRTGVKVTARYGWTTVPDAVKLATMIQASRLFARRDDVYGNLTGKDVDDVAYRWSASSGLDDDMLTTVGPSRRIWAAA
jgi:hypothetical protein